MMPPRRSCRTSPAPLTGLAEGGRKALTTKGAGTVSVVAALAGIRVEYRAGDATAREAGDGPGRGNP